MLLGMMNDPRVPVEQEIRWAAEHAFDFIDLTLEPPQAWGQKVDRKAVQAALARASLRLVGHTAYYLPVDSVFPRLQQAALNQMVEDMTTLAGLGAAKVTVHFGFSNPEKMFSQNARRQFWYRALDQLVPVAQTLGITLMLEHLTPTSTALDLLSEILADYPDVGFHLDVGHANLQSPENATPELLRRFGSRLHHVHVSDNFGGEKDLHLPLYCGNIDWQRIAKVLYDSGYNETVTLEVFSPRREYLLISRDIWRQIWRSVATPHVPTKP